MLLILEIALGVALGVALVALAPFILRALCEFIIEVGPVIIRLMLFMLVGGGIAVGLAHAAKALFGPAISFQVFLACVAFLVAAWCYLNWREKRKHDQDESVGAWIRWVARETMMSEVAVAAVATLLAYALIQAIHYRPGALLVIVWFSLIPIAVGCSFFLRTKWRFGKSMKGQSSHQAQRRQTGVDPL